MGIAGTAVGLLFIDPDIKSLFDQFIAILGMFLGVLAGLFALGVTTRRANAKGSLIGALIAIGFMFCIVMAAKNIILLGVDFRSIFDAAGTKIYLINGYLYAAFGITICYIAGYVASLFFANPNRDLEGLTWYR